MPEQAQGWSGKTVKYKGMWDVLAKAVEKEGVKGLYKVSSVMVPVSDVLLRAPGCLAVCLSYP